MAFQAFRTSAEEVGLLATSDGAVPLAFFDENLVAVALQTESCARAHLALRTMSI